MNTRFLTVLTTLAFLGFSVSAIAQKECQDGDTRPKCNPGGGGDDHGDPPVQYLAELTAGGFYFGSKVVTRNNRGNSYSSTEGLEMTREDIFGDGVSTTDTAAWDEVFSTCPSAFDEDPITDVIVSDDWSIDNSGGKSAGIPGSRVTMAFRNAYNPDYSDVEMDLFLVGTLPDEFPTGPDQEIEITLGDFWFYVHAHGNEGCKITTTFDSGDDSVLRMTWYVPPAQ